MMALECVLIPLEVRNVIPVPGTFGLFANGGGAVASLGVNLFDRCDIHHPGSPRSSIT